ncbi:MAG TPA: right-handed parallel beta-helix repeat-containing protein [Bryobacteraceae bacterium]|jgi:hypothetical protein
MSFLIRIALAGLAASLCAQTPSADVFVSPNGRDSWSGKLPAPNAAGTDGPLASVARAQAALRDLRKTKPDQKRVVMLRGGTYYLALSPTSPGTLAFTAFDSATAAFPTIWQNYPGETPIISGGAPAGKNWKHIAGALWQTPLPPETKPFESLYYNGQRRLRARVQAAAGVGYSMRNGACYSTVTKQPVALALCNLGTYLRIAAEVPAKGENAGCPAVANVAHPSASKCLDRFFYDAADPITKWTNLNNNDTSCPPTTGSAKEFPIGDIEVTLFNSWTVDVMRVSCVDTGKHIVYFSSGTRADSANYDSFGPVSGHRYMVENVKEAFDAAAASGQTGLWFLDRSTSPWTLNYLANAGENPNSDSVVIAQLGPVSPIGGSLISAVYLDCVTFRGITFEVDNFTAPPSGFNNDEISADTLPEMIDCVSCQDVIFDGITVRHTSASGILLASGSGDIDRPPTNNKVINSAFFDVGASGIRIGRHPLQSDRPNHVVQSVTIENNIIQGYSRVFPSASGIAQSNGHDVLYRHNDITDGYHSGLSVCLMGCPGRIANGFNITTEYNHIWNVMQGVTSDGGAMYFSLGALDGTGAGNKIVNNLVHDVSDSSPIDTKIPGYGYGGDGIFLDHKTAAVDIDSNVVFRVSDAGLAMNAGPAKGYPGNTFRNNIVAAARKSIVRFPAPWAPEGCGDKQLRVSFINNIFDLDHNANFRVIEGCSYSCGLEMDQFERFQANLYWRSGGGVATDLDLFEAATEPCAAKTPSTVKHLNFSQWQALKEDVTGTVAVDPGFGKMRQPKDFLLSRNPVAGFDSSRTNDTIQHAGRSHPAILPALVPPTFPAFPFQEY